MLSMNKIFMIILKKIWTRKWQLDTKWLIGREWKRGSIGKVIIKTAENKESKASAVFFLIFLSPPLCCWCCGFVSLALGPHFSPPHSLFILSSRRFEHSRVCMVNSTLRYKAGGLDFPLMETSGEELKILLLSSAFPQGVNVEDLERMNTQL